MKRMVLLLPLVLIISLFFFFQKGLEQNPKLLPSNLLQKSAPAFSLPSLNSHIVTTEKVFLHHETLLNIWASWCETCEAEQAYLLALSKAYPHLQIIGLNYKDNAEAARRWLKQNGNPYKIVLEDQKGQFAIDYGVYGTPETFLVGPDGIIQAKHVGVLDPAVFTEKFLSLIEATKG